MMKTKFTRAFLLCLAMVASLGVSSVQAYMKTMEDSNNVDITTVPTFYVKSDGQKYTGLSQKKHPLMNWQLPARFEYNAPGNDVIKSYHLQFRMKWIAGSGTQNFAGSHVSKSYDADDRPESINKNVSFPVDGSEISLFIVNACNARANGLRNFDGLSNKRIFSQDRQVDAKIYASHAIDIKRTLGQGFESVGPDFQDRFAKIICMKKPTPTVDAANTLSQESGVTDATLNILEQSTLGGSCKVNLSTVIETNLPNTTVEYRYEHNNGKKSDLKTVTTSHTKTAMAAHWYDVPNDPDKAETGFIRIIGVSHDFQSSWKHYNMTCNAKGPSRLARVLAKPKVKLDIVPINNITYEGLICPTKIKMVATLTSGKELRGTGVVTVKDGSYAFGSHEVFLSPNKPWIYEETFNLKPWNTVNAPAGMAGGSNTFQEQSGTNNSAPSQRFQVRYNLSANQRLVISTPYKMVVVRCRPAAFNPKLPGSGTVGINRQQPASGSNTKGVANAGLRSDGEFVQGKTPSKLAGHELGHSMQPGKVKPQSRTNRIGQRTTLYKGKLLQHCKSDRFPKNAVVIQAGKQRVVECFRGKVKVNMSKKVLKPWKKGDPIYPTRGK